MATLSLTAAATAAAQLLAVLDSGESLSSQQLTDALGLANALLDNWSSDPKKILSLSKISWPLSAGTQSYTIGAAQVINVTRPMAFVSAAFTNSSGPGGGVKVADADLWESLPDRQRQSYLIEHVFYDRGYPTGNVYVSPVALGNTITMEALVWAPLTQFADTTTPITILPGYIRLLETALALEMAPEYDVTPGPALMANYAAALAIVESLNASLFASLSPNQQAQIQKAAA